MTSKVLLVALANLLMLGLGCGLLPLLRLARTRWEIVLRLPLAYAVGLAATGILAAEFAVFGIGLGRFGLAVLALVTLAVGLAGLPGGERPRPRRPTPGEVVALLALAVTAGYAVAAARLAAVTPLTTFSGWETRARALYAFGHPTAPVFTDPIYGALRHALLVPALEAVAARFAGSFDERLLHLQLLGFALALLGGAWVLLRRWTNPALLAASLLAIVTAPAFFEKTLVNSSEIPLATFVALGVAALAVWVRSGGEPGSLPAATLFLASAAATQEDGALLALAAFAAAALAAHPGTRRPLAIAAAVAIVPALHWMAWLRVYSVRPHGASLWHLFSPAYLTRQADGIGAAVAELWHGLWQVQPRWYLAAFLALGLIGALLQRRGRVALFGIAWLVVAFAGLVPVYTLRESGSPDLPSASLALGAVLLVPLLAYVGTEPVPITAERRPHPLRRMLAPLAARLGPIVFPQDASSGGTLPWARPRRELLLLALVAAVTLSPIYSFSPQDVSRLCLTRALVHLHVSDGECYSSGYATDRAEYGGHFYSDKAPGMSVLEIPAAVATSVPEPGIWWLNDIRLWAVRVFSSGLALLLGALVLGRISEGLAPGYGSLSLVTFALGTLVAPFGAANFGSVAAGTLGLCAFALAWSRRPFLAGLLAGLAVLVEYQCALIVLTLAAYTAYRGRRSLVAYVLGVVPGGLLLAAYNWAAFDAPWRMSYRYVANEYTPEQAAGFFGIHLPYAHAIRDVFVGNGGLLRLSPVVVAAAFGLVLLARRYRAEALVCAAIVAAFVALNCGYFEPYGGSPGPRFLVPALPFLALGLAPAFAKRFWLTAILSSLSVAPMVVSMLTWHNAPGGPSSWIWGELDNLGSNSADFRLGLRENVLRAVGAGKESAAIVVAIAAAVAFLLALQVALARRRTTRPPVPQGPATQTLRPARRLDG